MASKNLLALIMVAVVVSFIGFAIENIWLALSKGFIDNRNMTLPFLLGYGIAMILVYIAFGLPHRPKFLGLNLYFKKKYFGYLYYYVVVMIGICIGELLLGTIVEKITGYQWWNYNWIPLHITQYTSIPTSMGFSAIVFIVMRYAFDPMMNYFLSINTPLLTKMSAIFGLILTADMIYNLAFIYRNGTGKLRWCIDFKRKSLITK